MDTKFHQDSSSEYPELTTNLLTSPLSKTFTVKQPKIGINRKFKKIHLEHLDSPSIQTTPSPSNTLTLSNCINMSKQNFLNYSINLNRIVYTDSPQDELPLLNSSISLENLTDLIHNDLSTVENTIHPLYGEFTNKNNNTNPYDFHDKFDSLFEEGNLRMAIEVNKNEFDLIMRKDINNEKNYSWFFFEYISTESKDVKFNIINFPKKKLLFCDNVRVLSYNTIDKWNRNTFNVHYYQNEIPMPLNLVDNTNNKEDDEIEEQQPNTKPTPAQSPPNCYTTLTFSFRITPKLINKPIYFAYCYPYTYTDLQQYLLNLSLNSSYRNYIKFSSLKNTICGNPLDIIYITNFNSSSDNNSNGHNESKETICLTARVHPGESNSSYVIEGVINTLLTSVADDLRNKYIFKIIPMLNPDGVINGNYRNNIYGKDLNRLWNEPHIEICPTIFNVKYLIALNKPSLYCDFHGHSSIANCCLYGCSKSSKISKFMNNKQHRYHEERVFMRIFEKNAHYYNKGSSRYTISKPKLKTARAVVYNELGVNMSYCLETSTMCTVKDEIVNGFIIENYKMVGEDFVKSLKKWSNKEVFYVVLKKIRTEVEEKKKKKENKKSLVEINTNNNNVLDNNGRIKKRKKLTLNETNTPSIQKLLYTISLGDENKKLQDNLSPNKVVNIYNNHMLTPSNNKIIHPNKINKQEHKHKSSTTRIQNNNNVSI